MIDEISWNTMYQYLIKQDNCVIQDKEMRIPNLYKTLNLYNEMINQHPADERSNNQNCKVLKRNLERIYKLHKQNKFKHISISK